MTRFVSIVLYPLVLVYGTQNTDTFKDQFCTDPRTMRKHAAYSEWADAYSCTRHRCQPGGRNLAIYTVGCKRVEAPESAIECEEVVEDTNMQFPYCCTRLRCLVVVRGEVWTRVLGQPWETLAAAPWSHMYKMKKPPPADSANMPRNMGEGPVYQLADASNEPHDKIRGPKDAGRDRTTVKDIMPEAVADIVTALSPEDKKKRRQKQRREKKKHNKPLKNNPFLEGDIVEQRDELEEPEKPQPIEPNLSEDEKQNGESLLKPTKAAQHKWTEIPQNQWNEPDPVEGGENGVTIIQKRRMTAKKVEQVQKNNLQDLVDAIGTRMRDIENVVQKMSEKVHHRKGDDSQEKSDASNAVLSRRNGAKPKEPATPSYIMAPVDNMKRISPQISPEEEEDLDEKRKKKHKRKGKKPHNVVPSVHKKHHKNVKHSFNRITDGEPDKTQLTQKSAEEEVTII